MEWNEVSWREKESEIWSSLHSANDGITDDGSAGLDSGFVICAPGGRMCAGYGFLSDRLMMDALI